MGDLLLLTPALKALKAAKPFAKTTLLLLHRRSYSGSIDSPDINKTSFIGTSQVFLNNADIDEIFELNRSVIRKLKGLSRLKAELKCVKFIKQRKFDAVICTFPQSRLILWSFLAGVKIRIGQKQQSLNFLLTDKPDIKAKGRGVLNYYSDLLKPLNIECRDFITKYIVSDEEKKLALKKLEEVNIFPGEKVVLIHPGASEPHKILPPKYFAEICDILESEGLGKVIICTSEYDNAAAAEIVKQSKNKLPLVKLDSIRELAAVMSICSLSLVNNSGPRHLAAALGCFNISFFQKFDNGEWSIYNDSRNIIIESSKPCRFCNEGICRSILPEGKTFGSECMHDIEVEKAIEIIKDILQKKS